MSIYLFHVPNEFGGGAIEQIICRFNFEKKNICYSVKCKQLMKKLHGIGEFLLDKREKVQKSHELMEMGLHIFKSGN